MLTRLLLVADVILIAAVALLGTELYRAWHATPVPPPGTRPLPAVGPPQGPPATHAAAPAPSLAAFATVAERNLFSPTRTEATAAPPKPAAATAAARPAAPAAPRPRLYGIVLGGDNGGRAYLEDPRTRKVFAYAIGDSVAESRLERIEADRVVLRRGTEIFEVLLRDPSKPRPAPAPAPPPAAARPGVSPTPATGSAPPGTEGDQPPAAGAAGTAPTAPPPGIGGRRPPIRVPAPSGRPDGSLPTGRDSGEGSGS